MKQTDIIAKTAAGVAEVASRSRKLPPRLRTMLILIDGSLSVAQLMDAGAKLAVPADFLDTLQQLGLVAVQPAAAPVAAAAPAATSETERFRAAQKFMNDAVVDALGFRAFFFTLKVEKCFTRSELVALLDDFTKAIAKGGGADVARVVTVRARELLIDL